MTTNEKEIVYKELSYKIIGLAMEVHSKLGYGFLEKVYGNAMILLFKREVINARKQAPIKVYFEGEVVGEYFVDILVEDKIILEIKALDKIIDVHIAQTLNYLKATGSQLAIILNFGKKKLEYERIVN
jgi:GxxExxY protein